MFVHSVYFWLRDDLSPEDRATFDSLLRALTTIEHVAHGYIGIPADTSREIIDRSYSYAEILVFKDRAAHDAYQAHPTHRMFAERCATFWRKIVIYDSVG